MPAETLLKPPKLKCISQQTGIHFYLMKKMLDIQI